MCAFPAYLLVEAKKDTNLAELAEKLYKLDRTKPPQPKKNYIIVRADEISGQTAVMVPVDPLTDAGVSEAEADILKVTGVDKIKSTVQVAPATENTDPHHPPGPPRPKKDEPSIEARNAWG